MPKTSTKTQSIAKHCERINYHPGIDRDIECWAGDSGWDAHQMREATEIAIRTRLHEAYIEELDKARGKQPDIYRLNLEPLVVVFTVEADTILVRGYEWETPEGSSDEVDAGGFFHDASWHTQSDD